MSAKYGADFYAWTQRQAALLRSGRAAEADLENIAEEIASMGRSELRELVSRLEALLTHLLKWRFQAGRRSRSWSQTIVEQRRQIDRHLRGNPSLRPLMDEAIAEAYENALRDTARETGLDASTMPPGCPFSRDEILTDRYAP